MPVPSLCPTPGDFHKAVVDNAEEHRQAYRDMTLDEQVEYIRLQLKGADIIAALTIPEPEPGKEQMWRATFIRGFDLVSGERPWPPGAPPKTYVHWSNLATLALLYIGYGSSERDHKKRMELRRYDRTATDKIAPWLVPANAALTGAYVMMALHEPNATTGIAAELIAAAEYMAAWSRGEPRSGS